jgi:hypothetical protein
VDSPLRSSSSPNGLPILGRPTPGMPPLHFPQSSSTFVPIYHSLPLFLWVCAYRI